MDLRLTEQQQARRDAARQFAADVLEPWADRIDSADSAPPSLLARIRESGYLGAALPSQWNGGAFDPVSYGLVSEEIGRASSSLLSLLTAHNMSAQAIVRCGTDEQKARWLPDLSAGKKIIAFALSEPDVGSSANDIGMLAVERGRDYELTGRKRWVTFGRNADLFLVFAKCDGRPVALVVERQCDELDIAPIANTLGARGSHLAQLQFSAARVPIRNRIGPVGAGISFVAATALDHGRFSVAWGSTGIIRACLEASLSYAAERHQGGRLLKDHQLVRRKLADMLVAHTASRALCYRSACLRDRGDPRAPSETSLAKYHASTAALRAATAALHLHGANGCSAEYPVARYLRDANVMGIIEGTHEIHQLALGNYAYQRPYLQE